MLLAWVVAAVLLLGTALSLSLWWTLFCFTPVALRVSHVRGPLRVGVVLGSGGHTSEMMRLISCMPPAYWSNNRPFYIVSATDTHSAGVAQEQELRLFGRNAILHVIPRAREVGQSYASSILSTLWALVKSFRVVACERPDVLLTNGPGVCVPVVAAGVLLAALMPWRYERPAVVYLESFTCVRHVSLTGRLLAPFAADIFTVLWRELLPAAMALRPRRGGEDTVGVFYIGCDANSAQAGAGERASERERVRPLSPILAVGGGTSDGKAAFALVTVGSTRFDKLIYAMATEPVCRILREKLGITHLLLQYGTSPFTLSIGTPCPMVDGVGAGTASGDGGGDTRASSPSPPFQRCLCAGVVVEAFPYRPNLSRWIAQADLVVTHAGAGTIMECLHAHVPVVVVPNRDLMSDHQLELAEALAARQSLFYLSAEEVGAALGELDLRRLRPHRTIDPVALQRVLCLPFSGRLPRDTGGDGEGAGEGGVGNGNHTRRGSASGGVTA